MNSVTSTQMERANMIRTSGSNIEFAVPIVYKQKIMFTWKTFFELNDEDYNRINAYFHNKIRT